MLRTISLAILIFVTSFAYSQKVVKCPDGLYWTIEKDSVNYTVALLGKVQTTERPNVIAVNDYSLQYLIVNKSPHVEEGGDNTELKILIRYAMSEAAYLSKQFNSELKPTLVKAPLSSDKDVLLWSYKMPTKISDQVANQLYANIIIGDKIFGLASPQFNDQEYDKVRDFLMDSINSLKRVEDLDELCGGK